MIDGCHCQVNFYKFDRLATFSQHVNVHSRSPLATFHLTRKFHRQSALAVHSGFDVAITNFAEKVTNLLPVIG